MHGINVHRKVKAKIESQKRERCEKVYNSKKNIRNTDVKLHKKKWKMKNKKNYISIVLNSVSSAL